MSRYRTGRASTHDRYTRADSIRSATASPVKATEINTCVNPSKPPSIIDQTRQAPEPRVDVHGAHVGFAGEFPDGEVSRRFVEHSPGRRQQQRPGHIVARSHIMSVPRVSER